MNIARASVAACLLLLPGACDSTSSDGEALGTEGPGDTGSPSTQTSSTDPSTSTTSGSPDPSTGSTSQPESTASPTSGPGDSDSGGTTGADTGRTCEGKEYLLCLDFEDTQVGEIPQGWTRNGDLVGVQDDFAHLGAHALRIDALPQWRRRIEHDAAMIGPAHWGRVFYRVAQPIPDADLVHSTHVSFVGVGPNIGEAEYRTFDTVKAGSTAEGIENRIQFIFNVQPDGPEFAQGTGWLDLYYEDVWHCAEWHVDAADQSFTFWYDSQEQFSFTNGAGNYTDSEIPDSYSLVTLGWTNYQTADPGYVAWYDDFAIDDERIGCE